MVGAHLERSGSGFGTLDSTRSRPGPDGVFVDVNELAARFGGGGHVHAAGAKQKGTLEAVVARVRAAVEA